MKSPLTLERSEVFNCPLDEIWPIAADTNRLNRYIGLFPADFSPFMPAGSLIRKAQGKAYGLLDIQWDEHVFEWVRGSYYSIERVYTKGPVDRVLWQVRTESETAGRTRVTLSGTFTYKNLIGKAALKKGIIPQLLKTFDYILEASAAVRGKPSTRESRSISVSETLLSEAEGQLVRAGNRKHAVTELLDTIRTGGDEQVTRMQPYRWADQHAISRDEAVRLFLTASEAGVLDYEWNLMCPNCRVSKARAAHLSEVTDTVHCDLCGVDFSLDFDRYIEMTFRVNGAVRKTVSQTFCVNGPANSPNTVAQFRIAPRTAHQIAWTRTPQNLQIRILKHNYRIPFKAGMGERTTVTVTPEGLLETQAVQADQLDLVNTTEEEIVLAVEETDWDPFALTASDITSRQLFRELLPTEVLAAGMQIGISKLTILFTDLKDSTLLYEQVGDAAAYSDVQKHFTLLGSIIAENGGTVVKTIGDSVMAAFSTHTSAFRAAFDIQLSVESLNASLRTPVTIKVGLHEGPVIAVNANGVLDYFGRTVNMAARVQQQSIGGDIVLEQGLYDRLDTDPDSQDTERFTASLHGMEERAELIRAFARTRPAAEKAVQQSV